MSEPQAADTALPPLKILLAEDNLINQKVASALLARHGHQVTVVADGRDALAAVRSESFDAVLMDVQMPEMDGIEATRAIRALGGAKGSVPIIAMSAAATEDDAEQCRAAGMDGHMAKPLDTAKVFALIGRCLARRSPENHRS
jgi:CheY-like chemotaxis protein